MYTISGIFLVMIISIILFILLFMFFVIRHVVTRSYYFNRKEIGLIRYCVTQCRHKIPEKEYSSILNEIKKRYTKNTK